MCGIPNKKLNMQTMRTNNSCLTIYLSIQSPNPSLNDVIMTSTVENLIKKIKTLNDILCNNLWKTILLKIKLGRYTYLTINSKQNQHKEKCGRP